MRPERNVKSQQKLALMRCERDSAPGFHLELPLSTPPYHRRGNHLPRLAEATAGPEDIDLVLVAAPVLVGSGSAASAVLGEGGGGIEDPSNSSGNHLLIAFPIYSEPPGEKVILPFFG